MVTKVEGKRCIEGLSHNKKAKLPTGQGTWERLMLMISTYSYNKCNADGDETPKPSASPAPLTPPEYSNIGLES